MATYNDLASRTRLFLAALFLGGFSVPLAAEEQYSLPPEATPRDGVARGTVERFSMVSNKHFPGTVREVAIYRPANLGDKPAAVMVFQDGPKYVRENGGWRLPTVFDNLIADGSMPPTVAVCVSPGVTPPTAASLIGSTGGAIVDKAKGQARFNRSFEYDSVSSRYADFLIDEVLPAVGARVAITEDPNLTAIGGSSSGAIAAFTAAWHRPDRFRRVFSTIGTYVGLRGGHNYPTLIRHCEPKPIRVFLQDGQNDLDIYGGDWFNANNGMLSALQWGGYPVEHTWGDGGHNGKHGAAVFPDALRWLWQDWKKPISPPSVTSHPEWSHWLVEGEGWELADPATAMPIAATAATNIAIGRTDAGDRLRWLVQTRPTRGDASSATESLVVDAATVTPDGRFLITANDGDRHTISRRVARDGRFEAVQEFGYLFAPLGQLSTGVTAATMTNEGEALFATDIGIQCFDQPGRVHLIIQSPDSSVPITNLQLQKDGLHVQLEDGRHFQRRVAVKSADGKVVIPPKPRL